MTLTLTGAGEPIRLNAQLVSFEFFPLLGVTPLLGRVPFEADDRPNAPTVAVLSYQLWQRRFAGNAAVIGRIVQLNDRPVEIIGVMPASFRFIHQDIDIWGRVSARSRATLAPDGGTIHQRGRPSESRSDHFRGAGRPRSDRPAARGTV